MIIEKERQEAQAEIEAARATALRCNKRWMSRLTL